MAVLVISTHRGKRYEAEVRDYRDAEREISRFQRLYIANHPNDKIVDASIISRGGVIARCRNGRLEAF